MTRTRTTTTMIVMMMVVMVMTAALLLEEAVFGDENQSEEDANYDLRTKDPTAPWLCGSSKPPKPNFPPLQLPDCRDGIAVVGVTD